MDNSLFDFFYKDFNKKESLKLVSQCKKWNIVTIEQFQSRTNFIAPTFSLKEKKDRGILESYGCKNEKAQNPLNTILKTSSENRDKVAKQLKKLPKRNHSNVQIKSEFYMGAKVAKTIHKSRFWNDATIKPKSKQTLIPNYEKHYKVFDQGERGTCVANAVTFLMDYITGTKTSRQFLYYQCKKTDNIPNSEGTYPSVALDLLANTKRNDVGAVSESVWRYNQSPVRGNKGQGPAPERCYKGSRYIGLDTVHCRKNRIVSDIKDLLVGSNIHPAAPVEVSVPLFSSFKSISTRRTGWVTMPFPNENIAGYHSMVIVGYNDEDRVFIVRNSWGNSWAAENKYGLSGHALIPYSYISKYAHSAMTLLWSKRSWASIPNGYRLNENGERKMVPQKRVIKRITSSVKNIIDTIIKSVAVVLFVIIGVLMLVQFL